MTRSLLALTIFAACGSPWVPATTPAPVVRQSDHELRIDTVTEGSGLHTRISGHEVELARLPIAEWISLPMSGKADVAIDVVVPVDHGRRDYRGAKGSIDVRCLGSCRVGDDQTKLQVAQHAFDVGHIDLSELEIHATIGGGHVTVTRWTAKGDAGLDAIVAGQIELARDLDDSVVAGCVRVAVPELDAALGSDFPPRASDGRRNIRIGGHLGHIHRLLQICDGSVPLMPDLQPDEVAATPAAEDDDPQRSIHTVDTGHYEIDRDLIDRVFANPMAFAKGARIVPAMKNGQPYGFKLYAIRPDSLLARLGFQNGDTLVRVNGFDLTSPDKALEVYAKLRDATSIQIDLERRGQAISIAYSIR